MRSIFVLIVLMTQLSAEAPVWFASFQQGGQNEIIGYGEGNNLDEAKANAKSDISKSIRSHIDSSFKAETSVNNTTVNHNAQSNIIETSNISITDTQLIKSEQTNGRFYVALRYDNLPLYIKLAKRGGKLLCGSPHLYLAQTSIVLNLSSELNCSTAVDITRENNGWYLGLGEHRVVLNEVDFQKLMIETSSTSLTMKTNKTLVHEDESYSLLFDGLPSSGYLSLFDVYEDGRVVVMQSNMKLSPASKKALQYPDDVRSDVELSGGLLEVGKDTMDMHVALVSNESLKLSSFIPMGHAEEKGSRAYAFDQLLMLMQNNTFATTVVTTKVSKK